MDTRGNERPHQGQWERRAREGWQESYRRPSPLPRGMGAVDSFKLGVT